MLRVAGDHKLQVVECDHATALDQIAENHASRPRSSDSSMPSMFDPTTVVAGTISTGLGAAT
jgi:hypothetical protein